MAGDVSPVAMFSFNKFHHSEYLVYWNIFSLLIFSFSKFHQPIQEFQELIQVSKLQLKWKKYKSFKMF